MADPLLFRSLEDATGEGAGEHTLTKGHNAFTLYVRVRSTAATQPSDLSFECTMEASPTDQHFSPVDYRAPVDDDVFLLTESELIQSSDDSDVFVGQLSSNSFATNYVRANATAVGADVDSFDAIIEMVGWNGGGKRYQGSRGYGDDHVDPEYDTV